jgi:signal transduction histidine kinase/CheY-like chemotaxis protein
MPPSFSQGLLDSIPAPFAIVDAASHRLVAVNSTFAQYLGAPTGEFLDVPFIDALAEADRAGVSEALQHLDATHSVALQQVQFNAHHAPCQLELQLQYVDGEAPYIVGVLRDTSSRRSSSNASEGDCNARNSALLRAIPDSIYRLDPDGTIIDHKPESSLTKRDQTAGSDGGLSFFDLASNEVDRVLLRDAVRRALSSGELQSVEYQSDRAGKHGMYEARFVAEETGRVVAIVRDLTENRQNHENRARIEKLEALGILAGGIAHDFNNLVAGSFGHVEMAREYVIEDKADRAVDCLNEAARSFGRARELTRQLLTFSKGGTPKKVPGDLAGVVQHATESVAISPGVTLSIAPAPKLPTVAFDESQMIQVVDNLVVNACDAMPHGGTLEIGFSEVDVSFGDQLPLPAGTYVCLSIKDSGTGIPLEHMPKLFDPFFTTKPNGTGLGLASTFSIVKRHGGHLDVVSELGKGTDCRVYLPVDAEMRVEPAQQQISGRPTRQGRVLVMDDEDAVRRVTSSFLMRLGYEVALAADGGEAIEIFRRTVRNGQQFAFIILDLTVPGGLGGRETLESIRKIDSHVTAIATTGYSNDPILSSPESYGFRAGLAKPYSRQEFLSLIGRVTG